MRAGAVLLGFLAGVAVGVVVTSLLIGDLGVERAATVPAAVPQPLDASAPAPGSTPTAKPDSAPPAPADDHAALPAPAPIPDFDARLGLLVYGAIRDAAGAPVALEYDRISFLPESGEALYGTPDETGTYALARLRPGTWTVTTDLTGYRPTTATLKLDAAHPVTRFDIVVEPAVRLAVLAVAPDDVPLPEELEALFGAPGGRAGMLLTAIATVEPPDELGAEPGLLWARYGVGEFIERSRWGAVPLPTLRATPGTVGWLDVKVPLPVHVSLVLTGVVLGTQRVAAGQDEVLFRIPPEAVMATLASVSARFVDGFTLDPIEGVDLNFSAATLGDPSTTSDADGVAHQDLLLPGRVDLIASREGYEQLSTHVDVAAGQHTDLGNVPLYPETTISGLVLDAQGLPLAAELLVTTTEPTGPMPVDLMSWRWSSADDGTFAIGPLGRRRYAVRVESEKLISAPVFVDARGGDVSGLLLRAEPGQMVSVRITWPPAVSHGVRLRSAEAGVWDEQNRWRGPGVWTRRFAAGNYVAECFDGATVLQSVPFAVADRPVSLTLSDR